MFTGYNLVVEDRYKSIFEYYESRGRNHLADQKASFKEKIKDYIINGVGDGTKMESDWFPQIEADIFISHSHADEALATGIAGWLNSNFGLRCFIDSCVWNYCDDLLDKINAQFSDKRKDSNGGYLYDYKKCNVASKHVNTMLSVALQKMIDKTEMVLLLNTSNSVTSYENVYEEVTYSPWIYSEITCTQIVRKKPLSEYRKYESIIKHFFESGQMRHDESEFKAVYEVSLSHLGKMSADTLLIWKEECKNKKNLYPLDYLYKITYPKEMKNIGEFKKRYDILIG